MTIRIYWQIDVAADPGRAERSTGRPAAALFRDVRSPARNRYDYYAQIAQGAAQTGFDGVFIPHRGQADDAGIVAATIAREVPRIRLVAEFPASAGSAVYAAKQAVSFQRLAHDRLDWAIAPAGSVEERVRDGDSVGDEDLSARTAEFLTVARGVHGEHPFTFAGRFFEVKDGGFEAPLNRVPFPRVFLQGDSEEALALSARLADVHLFAAAQIDTLRHRIEALEALAVHAGRTVDFGVLQPVLARDTDDEARRDAARAGAGEYAIVGDHAAVAARLAELSRLGIGHIVLSASPSLEEVYTVGQHVLPRFRALAGSTRVAA